MGQVRVVNRGQFDKVLFWRLKVSYDALGGKDTMAFGKIPRLQRLID